MIEHLQFASSLRVVPCEIPAWSTPLYSMSCRYKVMYGGRGSGKSEAVASALVSIAARRVVRILCCREFQRSIKESVHATMRAMITRLGLEDKFEVTEHTIRGVNGSEFIFEGLHANSSAIKSLHGIDYVWVEEAETVSAESWKYLIPTIRKIGSEIWITFNPRDEEDPTWQLTKKLSRRDDAWVVCVNWRDNPFFPPVLEDERQADLKTDPDLAAHVWEGEFRKNSAAQIFAGKYRIEAFEPQPDFDGPWYGMDHGFGSDPMSCHEYWAKGFTLYVRRESYHYRLPLNKISETVMRDIPNLTKYPHTIRADNSRPETINHLNGLVVHLSNGTDEQGVPKTKRMSLNVVAAQKWPGCVEDGIKFLHSLEAIVIHPDCKNAATEARFYSYKTDKATGRVLPVVLDRYNHFWDDCRYAMEAAIMTKERQVIATHSEPILDQGITPELDDFDRALNSPAVDIW